MWHKKKQDEEEISQEYHLWRKSLLLQWTNLRSSVNVTGYNLISSHVLKENPLQCHYSGIWKKKCFSTQMLLKLMSVCGWCLYIQQQVGLQRENHRWWWNFNTQSGRKWARMQLQDWLFLDSEGILWSDGCLHWQAVKLRSNSSCNTCNWLPQVCLSLVF